MNFDELGLLGVRKNCIQFPGVPRGFQQGHCDLERDVLARFVRVAHLERPQERLRVDAERHLSAGPSPPPLWGNPGCLSKTNSEQRN